VFIETVPLDATDRERGAQMLDLAEFVSGLQEAGMNPVVDVETTSGGDTFVITVDDAEPEQA
jgi:hypothetical protein